MTGGARLAGLIWAAILVVAVQLVPSTALAHAGHEHHRAGAHAPAAHHHAGHAAAHKATASATAEASIAATQDRETAAPACGGTGGCCGTGAGCCGGALIGSVCTLPDPIRSSGIVPSRFDWPSGIDPDALARPPRILA